MQQRDLLSAGHIVERRSRHIGGFAVDRQNFNLTHSEFEILVDEREEATGREAAAAAFADRSRVKPDGINRI